MLNVLLINPPAREASDEAIVVPPLGIAYLAAVARRVGHAVSIIDAFGEGLTWEGFASKVGRLKYDVIGLSGMTPVFDTVQRAIPICRPQARFLILGGPHATAFRETILDDNPDLDFAVYGEGEQTFIELLDAIEKNCITQTIPGIIIREGIGPPRDLLDNLDELPFPARDLLPVERYRYPLSGDSRMTTIISSRGCPFGCIFCDKGVFGSRWRARSAENVLAEVDEVVRKYGVKSIVFYDDLFTLKKDRLEKICKGLIKRKYPVKWKAEGRVDIIDEELLKLMRRAGCDTIAYGVESANQKSLDYLGKKTTPDMAQSAFGKTRAAGIRTMGYFILGIPVETYDEALKTIRFAKELNADFAQFSVLSPLPGTKLYREAKEKGWYHEVAAHSVADKDRLRPVVLSENWDEEKLISIVHRAHREFYLRPSYILKCLMRIQNMKELRKYINLGGKMVNYVFGRSR